MRERITFLIVAAMLLLASYAHSASLFNGQRTSQLATGLTASGQAVTGPCAFHGVLVKTDGVNAVTLSFYDNTSAAAGTVTMPTSIVLAATPQTQAISFGPPLYPQTGVYVSITVAGGGAATVWVNHDQ